MQQAMLEKSSVYVALATLLILLVSIINLQSILRTVDSDTPSHNCTSDHHSQLSVQATTLPPGYIAVTGHLTYSNLKLLNLQPLAWTRVTICKDDTPLGQEYTDINGWFTFGPIYAPNGTWIRLQVETLTWGARLLPGSGWNLYDDWSDPVFIQTGENKTIEWEIKRDNDRWTILSSQTGLTKGWIYINQTGQSVYDAVARYPYNIQYPAYNNTAKEILFPYVLDDPIYIYPDAILHEYAHYAMHYAYQWYWPENSTGDYDVTKHSNVNMSWVEGWAWFFPLAVKNDSNFIVSATIIYDFEPLHWCSANWDDGDDVIGRVTGALWDIYDPQDDGYDVLDLDYGFPRIWYIIITDPYQPENNFKEFWDAWNVTYCDDDWTNTLMAIFQNSIDYRGLGDVNADGIVDISDLYAVSGSYGAQKEGGQMWDKKWLDIVYDDMIDISDLYWVALNYGNEYNC